MKMIRSEFHSHIGHSVTDRQQQQQNNIKQHTAYTYHREKKENQETMKQASLLTTCLPVFDILFLCNLIIYQTNEKKITLKYKRNLLIYFHSLSL